MAHNTKITIKEDIKVEHLVSQANAAEAAEKTDRPSGDKLEKEARAALSECIKKLDGYCKELEDVSSGQCARGPGPHLLRFALSASPDTTLLLQAQAELEVMKEDIKQNGGGDPSARSKLIHVEGNVESCEHKVEDALNDLDDAEVILERAVVRRTKERQILPLYRPLASSLDDSDFSAPLLDITCALISACTDQFSEKLRLLVEMFDFDADRFLSLTELRDLLACLCRVLHGKVLKRGAAMNCLPTVVRH